MGNNYHRNSIKVLFVLGIVLTGFSVHKFTNAQTTLCIITISGVQYDVTQLRYSHSGPTDTSSRIFFVCGSDMTASYQGEHGTNMNRMRNYIYTPPTNTPQQPTPTPIPGDSNNDRHINFTDLDAFLKSAFQSIFPYNAIVTRYGI